MNSSDPKMEANSHLMVYFSDERPTKLIQEVVDEVSHIEKLGDELLLEILIRLPNCESAIRCKCISKRWLNLISTNLFVAQFERNSHKIPLPFALMITYLRHRTHVYCKDKEANFGCFGLTSNFLSPLCKEQEQPRLVAVHMDLLLFRIDRIRRMEDAFELTYVICNPRTKQWFSLPPLLPSSGMNCFQSAIVWEPYCSSENYNGKHCIQDSFRYRVFSIQSVQSSGSGQPKLYVYKSETGQWELLFLSCTHCSMDIRYPPTMYNGKLHLLNPSNIVAFDPFGAEDEDGAVICCVIDVPSELDRFDYMKHLGTSSGSLLLCMVDVHQSILKVWDLKDYDKGECRLKHEISMIDVMRIEPYAIGPARIIRVMGFHPCDMDIIYVYYNDCILECNMQARTSHVVYDCQDIKDALTPEGNKDALFARIYQVFLPWWPTPIPALT